MLPFDELNRLAREQKPRSMDIEKYFSAMALPAEEKENRIEFAKKLEDRLFLFLAFIYVLAERGSLGNLPAAKEGLARDIAAMMEEYTYPDSAMLEYINRYVDNFVDTTMKRGIVDGEEAAYWFSEDRARFSAEDEANTLFNYEQYRQAVEDGYTHKRWIAMKDERVRLTHAEVDGTTVPIDEYFSVGDWMMRFPKDPEAGPEETVNCRCSMLFFDKKEMLLATANALFVNKKELLYKNAQRIIPIEDYEDFTCHANPDAFEIDLVGNGNEKDFIELTPEEYAERIKNSSAYQGGNVRLISCRAGAKKDGAAQRLANALSKNVMASTEKVRVDEDGNIFLTDNDILAEIWYYASKEERATFHQTGSWITFKPKL